MIALLVVGPEELPKVARKVAVFIGEIRRHGEDVRTQVRDLIDDAVSEEDMKSTVESIDKVRSTFSLGALTEPSADKSATRLPRAAFEDDADAGSGESDRSAESGGAAEK